MTHIEELIAGALIAGSTLLTANTAFTTPAPNAGVTGSDDALITLAPNATFNPPDAALAKAYRRAIRRALDDLRSQYPHTGNACTLLQSFDLVAACASSVATAQFPPALMPAAIADTLAANLDRLLQGHDEREIAFLQHHLLPATARALRAELADDPEARRSYQAWLKNLSER